MSKRCSCGVVLKSRESDARHRGSFFHRRARMVIKMLDKLYSLNRIGQELGISRQRVHQIVSQLPIKSGRERQKLRVHEARLERIPEVMAFIRLAKSHGLKAQPVKAGYGQEFSRRLVMVNGYKVRLMRAPRRREGAFGVIKPKTFGDADFAAIFLPNKKWLIVPKDKMPQAPTSFVPEVRFPKTSGDQRHDWRDYVEAWSLLKGGYNEDLAS